jgi:hypothetical protein
VGGVLVLALVLVFFWWNRRRNKRQHEALAQADQLEGHKPPFGPYGGEHAPATMSVLPGMNGTVSFKKTPSIGVPAGAVSSTSNTEIYEADSIMCSSPPQSTLSWTPRDSRYTSQISHMSSGSYDMGREGVQNIYSISELDGTEISRDNNDQRNQNTSGLGLNNYIR